MKATTQILRAILPLFALATLFWGTSCTTNTIIETLQPAQMKLPDHIGTMATIDRSKPSSGFTTVLEGLFTGERIGQDRRGREEALMGVNSALTQTPRLSLKPTQVELEGTRGGVNMAPPLDWAAIEDLCETYGTDAVLSIEAYDSDINVITNRFEDTYKDDEGNERVRYSWSADANANVRIGWRLYDPKTKTILDEHFTFSSGTFSGNGPTQRAATNDLPDMAFAVFGMSRDAGHQYGMRVAPVWVTVSRPYFTRGKKPFKQDMQTATRNAQAGRWDAAMKTWAYLAENADRKTAGRAAHNMAVAYERLGELETALAWADKSYIAFGNNGGRSYSQLLRLRIAEAVQVEHQLDVPES